MVVRLELPPHCGLWVLPVEKQEDSEAALFV